MFLGEGIWRQFTIVTYRHSLTYRKTWFLGRDFKKGIHRLLRETVLWYNLHDCYQFDSKRPFSKISTNDTMNFTYICLLWAWIFWNRFRELLQFHKINTFLFTKNYFIMHITFKSKTPVRNRKFESDSLLSFSLSNFSGYLQKKECVMANGNEEWEMGMRNDKAECE